MANQPLFADLQRAPAARSEGESQRIRRQGEDLEPQLVAAGKPLAHFLPLQGGDVAEIFLPVEQRKMNLLDVGCQLLLEQEG